MLFNRKTALTIFFMICFVWSFMFAGCSKVNKANYEKLKIGMGYEEVVKIIGNPDSCKTTLGVRSCVWGKSSKQIKVKFVADKVIWLSSDGL